MRHAQKGVWGSTKLCNTKFECAILFLVASRWENR